jgi:hypothetical protein
MNFGLSDFEVALELVSQFLEELMDHSVLEQYWSCHLEPY